MLERKTDREELGCFWQPLPPPGVGAVGAVTVWKARGLGLGLSPPPLPWP